MKVAGRIRALAHKVATGLASFHDDQRGMGAVEFALIVPMLIVVYLASFELTTSLSVAKRVTKAAATVADIVTQSSTVSKTSLATMSDVTKAILVPYASTGMVLKISGITVDATKNAKVAWSWSSSGTAPYAVNSNATVPSSMLFADTFLVRSELAVPHELLTFIPNPGGVDIKNITVSREYYFRQRLNNKIDCSNC